MLSRLVRLPSNNSARRAFSSKAWKSFATVDPWNVSKENPHTVKNLLEGKWHKAKDVSDLVDPLNGEVFMKVSNTSVAELDAFIASANSCPKSGLHNPMKNPERYVALGAATAKAAAKMNDPEVKMFFARLIQRVAPKSIAQAMGEVSVTQKFLENFGGDQVRFLARGFSVPGDHPGQMSNGYRWPYGPVTIIAPFNFPLEIPMLQLMGALFMGNKVTLKVDTKVAAVMEQALLLLIESGISASDVNFINCDGPTMHKFLMDSKPKMTQFTGSSAVANMLAKDLAGKVKLEDAGFDWKILGPDVKHVDYVASVSDQDAYAYSGQKCSAQSILFVHENWNKAGIKDKLKSLASRRNLQDLTIGPVLTVNNERFLKHKNNLLKIPGATVLFGGELLKNHSIPACYGSFEPTAISIPLSEFLKPGNFELCTTEIFGPFQIVVDYDDDSLDGVLESLERMDHHLTAAVVSNDVEFQRKVLSSTVNGTTYCGIRARTTGAPQNHWFGPAGDPRGAGIGSPEAIKLVWSCHREVIMDEAAVPAHWTTPIAS